MRHPLVSNPISPLISSAGATSLSVITVTFPNPEWSPTASTTFQRLNASLSFLFSSPSHIVTLSSNSATPGQDVTGLLYTPILPAGNDGCRTAGDYTIPSNATTRANLPKADYDLIAVAPWGSPGCVLQYLNSVQEDPIVGFIFFLPDNSTTAPPAANSNAWSLGDSNEWKGDNHFPVYAIPGQSGDLILRNSALYSGNMTDVPHGHLLTESYDSRDYVRLFVDVQTSGGTSLPSLWVFLLVVLGILLCVIGLTSFVMHMLQRRRRQTLRRRVANGEVDLEALGIKRLTVPQEILDEMPLYTYGDGIAVRPTAVRSLARETPARESEILGKEEPIAESSRAPRRAQISTLDQPTCAICLDDFVPATSSAQGTIVRELPCRHIFHPECVDTFLRDNSSLCPMCKNTALPKGYCPRIVTNAMVRRERMVRRIRPRVSAADVDAEVDAALAAEDRRVSLPYSVTAARSAGLPDGRSPTTFDWPANSRRTGSSMQPRRASAASPPLEQSEMSELPSTSSPITPPPAAAMGSDSPQPPSNPRRREWARQRAVAMLGRYRAPVDPEAEEQARTPGWRKMVRRVFPGAR